MNKIDYKIPGTKIPKLPENISYRCSFWDNSCLISRLGGWEGLEFISYGYREYKNEIYILLETGNYIGNNYFMVKESDILKLTEEMNKQNNLPKYWVVKNTNNDDFKVVIDYIHDNYTIHYNGNQTNYYYGYDGTPGLNGINCCYYISGFKNNPTILTIEEFKKAIGMEDNFILPNKWCVKITEDTKETFKVNNINSMCYVNSVIGRFFCCDNYEFKWHSANIYGTEITFEQFKKYVLKIKDKMESNKKIISYKLIKDLPWVRAGVIFTEDNNNRLYYNYNGGVRANMIYLPDIKNNDFFEPIYEEEVKTINMGSFNLTVKDKKCYYNQEDITDFVKGVHEFSITQVIAKWSADIKEITFSKTGCQIAETKLSDWLKVYDMIK